MTSSNYKPDLISNFLEHISGKYKVLDFFLSAASVIAISFWTVMMRTGYDWDASFRFFDPTVLPLILKTVLAFCVIRKLRLMYKSI